MALTRDLRVMNPTLYLLSYRGIGDFQFLVILLIYIPSPAS